MPNLTMAAPSQFDLAVFEDHFLRALDPFLPHIQQWYEHYYDQVFDSLGSFNVKGAPYGLMYRFCLSKNHSAIKGLQAYTFVPCANLNLPSAKGGVRNNLMRLFSDDGWLHYKSFWICLKKSLFDTNNGGMFLAIVTEEFYNTLPVGRFVWLGAEDIMYLQRDVVPQTLKRKLAQILKRGRD